MSQTCTTPAPSIDLSLLDTPRITALAAEPTPEEYMAALDAQTITPTEFKNPVALALLAIDPGWLTKAQYIEDCDKYGYIDKCGNDHFRGVRIFYCKCRFSPCCRDRMAQEITARWKDVIDHIVEKHHNARHVLMELRIPGERSSDMAKHHLSQIGKDINSLTHERTIESHKDTSLPCFHGEVDPYWINVPGYDGNELVIRVLIADSDSKGTSTVSTDAWRRLWPEARVSVNVGKHLTFRSAFNSLVKPLALDDPADCMEQEVIFHHMQLFRAHKASLTCTESINIITNTEIAEAEATMELSLDDTRDNSPTEPKPNSPKGKTSSPCLICGDTRSVHSGRLTVGSREMTNAIAQARGLSDLIRPPG
jgi:hypothetical protein